MLLGIDAGNNEVKVATEKGVFSFNSCLGDARERRIITPYKDEMILHYDNETYWVGELAEKESNFPRRSMGATKANEDVKLRILTAIHRYSDDKHNTIVVGQPIEMHLPNEKDKLKRMLKGKYRVVLNGIEKEFIIDEVAVAVEGASSFFGWFVESSSFRIVDCGSGTVNVASIIDWEQNDKQSFTLTFGANSTRANDLTALARGIVSESTKHFHEDDFVLLVGGAANKIYPVIKQTYPNTKIGQPVHKRNNEYTLVHPKYANAIGFYNLAKEIYNNG